MDLGSYSSGCALQKSDLDLTKPSIAIVTVTSTKRSCKFYNFSLFLVTVCGTRESQNELDGEGIKYNLTKFGIEISFNVQDFIGEIYQAC